MQQYTSMHIALTSTITSIAITSKVYTSNAIKKQLQVPKYKYVNGPTSGIMVPHQLAQKARVSVNAQNFNAFCCDCR